MIFSGSPTSVSANMPKNQGYTPVNITTAPQT